MHVSEGWWYPPLFLAFLTVPFVVAVPLVITQAATPLVVFKEPVSLCPAFWAFSLLAYTERPLIRVHVSEGW